MSDRLRNILKFTTVGIALGVLAGCATVDDDELRTAVDESVGDQLDELRSEIADVREIAENAQATADEALDKADSADRKARSAQSTATDAKGRAESTEEKVDRMFERAMEK